MGFRTAYEPNDPHPTTTRTGPLRTRTTRGPWRTPTSRRHHGLTGPHALRYDAHAPATTHLHDLHEPLTDHHQLTYAIHPTHRHAPSITVTLDDGTTHAADTTNLIPHQWNLIHLPLPHPGRTATTLHLTHTGPRTHGWIDTLTLTTTPPPPTSPVERALTTRGTHSTRAYSRGNTLPATAHPHGADLWTPLTHHNTNWEYAYHRQRGLIALGLSHLPSPWMGDRNTFHLMPTTGTRVSPRARRTPFHHTDETAHPHHYALTLTNGIHLELTPTPHGAALRATYPPGQPANLVLDNAGLRGDAGRIHLHGATFTAHTDVRSTLSTGATRTWIHATADLDVLDARHRLRGLARTRTALIRYRPATTGPTTLTLRIATSLISPDQARANHDTELATTDFDTLKTRAHDAWKPLLDPITPTGATPDQLTTLHSNLYRLHLYPNLTTEGPPPGLHRNPFTGRTAPGPLAVNNGFWDTYRTCWPAYALLTPELCGTLIDGFLTHHRDGGWISRWSSPGPANLMTGTNSDAAFADAHAKGVPGFDPHTAYQAALRNATTLPPNDSVGRKGLTDALFRHHTTTATPEGLSWAMENCVNDAATATMADTLGDPDTAAYLRDRSRHYLHHHDPATGFFQGINPDGTRRWTPQQYDPRTWGHDYTETNGWTALFAAPHDPAGLAALLGGPEALADRLDEYFTTPEDATRPGSYRHTIHEMREARDVNLGQYGHSNQPAHHIPYLYTHTTRPWRTQHLVRDICTRLYQGSTIGQGYLGDEDNGEMSAWWIFSALGFYPLTPASGTYALGSPLFPRTTVRLGTRTLTINAPGNTPHTPYVATLHVNGEPHRHPHIAHTTLTAGATLDYTMSPTPTDWFLPAQPQPLTHPLHDLTATTPGPLHDDQAHTPTTITQPLTLPTPGEVRIYTLTSPDPTTAPRDWVLEGSPNGHTWTTLDRRTDQDFPWPHQTRPFAITTPTHHNHHRLTFTGTPTLTQIQLLAP